YASHDQVRAFRTHRHHPFFAAWMEPRRRAPAQVERSAPGVHSALAALADGGTLLLEESGALPPPVQTRLLRVLAEQAMTPLGAERPVKVDLRVIAASHRDLRQMVESGAFREDLFYRLNGASLKLPP